MNREDIIRMAEEAGAIHYWHLSNLERFAALVASAERERLTDAAMKSAEKAVDVAIALEREACAKVCDEFYFQNYPDAEEWERSEEGEAIRKRSRV